MFWNRSLFFPGEMMFNNHFWGLGWTLLFPLAIIDLALRGFALLKSAKSGQNIWFIFLLIVNSLGILPAIYLLLNRAKPSKKK